MPETDEQQHADSGFHFVVPKRLVYWVLGLYGVGVYSFGGATGYTLAPVTNQLATSTGLEQCFNTATLAVENSNRAIDVAVQHGEELVDVRSQIQEVRAHSYTIERHERYRDRQYEQRALIEGKLDAVESRLEALERRDR